MEGGGLEDGKGVTAATDSGGPHLCSGSEGGKTGQNKKIQISEKENKRIIPMMMMG